MVTQVVSLARVELLQSLAAGEIQLAFQPQIELSTEKIVAFEGVARWHHPKLGILSPGLFFSLAAKEGLIGVMSRTLAAQAARAIYTWRNHGYGIDVAINISMTDVLGPGFARDLANCVANEGAKAEWIVLEIDEEELTCTGTQGLACLEILADFGFKIALDAKGPPSLALDKRARALFCQLKCGGSTMLAVASRLHSVGASAFMRRIQAAQGAGMPIVAVGAESAKAVRQCYQIGFTRLQGHFISLPLSFQSASQILLEQPSELEADDDRQPGSEAEPPTLEVALESAQEPDLDEQTTQPPHKPLQLFSFEELTEPNQAGAEAA
jgi:EAL domain-containing protein (putative c-di-GMP-specific phosphodiesterase class I)